MTLAPKQQGPAAWVGVDMADSSVWTWTLSSAHVDEILTAVDRLAISHAGDLVGLTAAEFALPTLAPRLMSLANELISGRGFELVRGLPAVSYTHLTLPTTPYV